MNPRITAIENLIASDPGGRNIFGLMIADQLRLAAQSLTLAKRVAIVSGFYIPRADATETDGPPGAKLLGDVLGLFGIEVDYITDPLNLPAFHALGLDAIVDIDGYLDRARPTHLVSVERVGRGVDGKYRNMHGTDITDVTAPLDALFIEGSRRGITTIGIGDGGNEIGMGKVFTDVLDKIKNGRSVATVVATDFCIAAGVSNWGAYGLAGALSVLADRDLLPSAERVARDLEKIVHEGGAVDGVTCLPEVTTDGLELSESLRMLESIRELIAPSPLERDGSLLVGVLGYGAAGRAVTTLLTNNGHRVRISDEKPVKLTPGTVMADVESGQHTIGFLEACDMIVSSPGMRPDTPIFETLHRRGIPVMSELELAYQINLRKQRKTPIIGVTGTIGKRTTVELLQRLFHSAGEPLVIGGNRGKPLSDLLLDNSLDNPVALAISSFQLESIVHFRPNVAVLLNVEQAHLDRHKSVPEYTRIKSRIFMNHRPDDALILPFDDKRLRPLARKHQGQTFFISALHEVPRGAWLANGSIRTNIDGTVDTITPAESPFIENLLAAVLTARLCGLKPEQISRALTSIQEDDAPRSSETDSLAAS